VESIHTLSLGPSSRGKLRMPTQEIVSPLQQGMYVHICCGNAATTDVCYEFDWKFVIRTCKADIGC